MKHILLYFSFFLFLQISSSAQITGSYEGTAEAQKFDQILLNTHSQEELQDLYTNHPEDYNILSYYFLSSYQLVITDASNPNLPLFDLANFDISKYENRRLLNETLELNFDKYGVKLILIPFNQLAYLTPIQEVYKEKLENQ